jgi:biotin-(acetyl-CoA carboxylase) ligase
MGVNIRMPNAESDDLKLAIDRPWTDLASRFGMNSEAPVRNELVAMILDETLPALELFEASGFEPFRADWENLDLLIRRAGHAESTPTAACCWKVQTAKCGPSIPARSA